MTAFGWFVLDPALILTALWGIYVCVRDEWRQ